MKWLRIVYVRYLLDNKYIIKYAFRPLVEVAYMNITEIFKMTYCIEILNVVIMSSHKYPVRNIFINTQYPQ